MRLASGGRCLPFFVLAMVQHAFEGVVHRDIVREVPRRVSHGADL